MENIYDEKNDVHYMGDSDEKELEEIKRIDNENKINKEYDKNR